MRNIVAAINMTIDGYCDHTAISPDEAIHDHYSGLLRQADAILYGRITYELMKFWKDMLNHPSGNKSMDEFAVIMNQVPKWVFSRTLKDPQWESAQLANKSVESMVAEFKQQPGRDVFVGSRSLMIQLMQQNLIDEFQLCIHPVIAGGGLHLFEKMHVRKSMKLKATRTFDSGAMVLYYQPQ